MRRIRLTVAYDGTNYVGWQVQPNGVSIEEILNREISRMLKEKVTVIGASRTDSGVHARGNVCVFDTESRIPGDKFKFAINESLPPDIVIQESEEVPVTYHPRKVRSIKTYEYKILNRTLPDPLERLDSYFFYYPLDVEKMRKASEVLLGEHDFRSFCNIHASVKTTVRRILSLDIDKAGDMITVRIVGNGFLYNQVRIIVGTLVKIGCGLWPVEKMEEALKACDRSAAGPTAPAKGLTLISIVEEESGAADDDNEE
ncbi:MAG: tRNA pseudouridine(38-40) synthase TruA [Lachnospiraceae bacterium]|nr:tRNA pseudouridine(38-40) synthase TruA [Lachnospiraceae bacterium]